jgi:hypothetical protein
MGTDLIFHNLTYGRCEMLIVRNEYGDGVMIPKTKFVPGSKLVPVIVNKNNISELATSWTGLRRALFNDTAISDFKRAFAHTILGKDAEGNLVNPGSDIGALEFDELSTITIKKGIAFDPVKFGEFFFTDPKHLSEAQYRGEKHTAKKVFPTARGSAWLFKTLRDYGYGIEVSSFSFT